jgi:hypothetical protein
MIERLFHYLSDVISTIFLAGSCPADPYRAFGLKVLRRHKLLHEDWSKKLRSDLINECHPHFLQSLLRSLLIRHFDARPRWHLVAGCSESVAWVFSMNTLLEVKCEGCPSRGHDYARDLRS